jgi:Na+-translocating ferredoxin:NAD+ oxidoreductase RnfA subunit
MLTLLFRMPAVGDRRWDPRAWSVYASINCVASLSTCLGPLARSADRPLPADAVRVAVGTAVVSAVVAGATLFVRSTSPWLRRLLGSYDVFLVAVNIAVATLVMSIPGRCPWWMAPIYVLPPVVGATVLVYRCLRVAARGRLDVVACVVGALAVALLIYQFGHHRTGTVFLPTTPLVALVARLPAGVDVALRALRWARMWRVFGRLRSLHRHVDPATVLVRHGKRFDPYHRVRRMLLELGEWRWALTSRFDPDVAARAERRSRRAGLSGTALLAAVEAAQLKAATRGEHRHAEHRAPTADGTGIADECAWWTAVARSYAESAQRC